MSWKAYLFIFMLGLVYILNDSICSCTNNDDQKHSNDLYIGIREFYRMAMGENKHKEQQGYFSCFTNLFRDDTEQYETDECEDDGNIFMEMFNKIKSILKCIVIGFWKLISPIFFFIGRQVQNVICLIAEFIDMFFKTICNILQCMLNATKWIINSVYSIVTYPFRRLKCWICGCPFSAGEKDIKVPLPVSEGYFTYLKDNAITVRIYCKEKEKECKKKMKSVPCKCDPKEAVMMPYKFFQKILNSICNMMDKISSYFKITKKAKREKC